MNLVNSQHLSTIVQELTILGKEDFIRFSEEQYKDQIRTVAQEVLSGGLKLVLLAGPSGSGKTTSAHNLAKLLTSYGPQVYTLSMDNWYRTHGSYPAPVDEDGNEDVESPACLDVDRFNSDLERLFNFETVTIPRFDFHERASHEDGPTIKLDPDDILIIEGLHALNPVFRIPEATKGIHVYASPADVIIREGEALDNQYIRLCRRIFRDFYTRDMTAEATIAKSKSVNRGERLYLEPFLHNVNVLRLDTLVDYELFIHRKMLPQMKELQVIPLSKITPDDIPDGSILREFYPKQHV